MRTRLYSYSDVYSLKSVDLRANDKSVRSESLIADVLPSLSISWSSVLIFMQRMRMRLARPPRVDTSKSSNISRLQGVDIHAKNEDATRTAVEYERRSRRISRGARYELHA